jgi:hypothetical protein
VFGFVDAFFDIEVVMPTAERLSAVADMYAAIGFPGGLGSMDATHGELGKCPDWLLHLCKGKEGYPTLGWMAIVDHNR